MSIVTNLTQQEIEKIQIDEGVVILDYGEETERVLAPCRGGGEFTATATVRDIEFDGRNGKVSGTQVIEEQAASIKVTTICMSQENLILMMPFCRVEGSDNKILKNPQMGLIPETAYPKNAALFAKLIDGSYKKITIYRPMHEGGFSVKAVQKAEGELALTLDAHYSKDELDGDLWAIEEITEFAMRGASNGGGAGA